MPVEVLKKERQYSFEEYFQLGEQEQGRYEYYDGAVVAMSGGSSNHNINNLNISRRLLDALEETNCRIFSGKCKVRTAKIQYLRIS